MSQEIDELIARALERIAGELGEYGMQLHLDMQRPLRVGQVSPPCHRYGGHEVSVLMVVLVDEPSTGDLAVYRSPTRQRAPANDQAMVRAMIEP